MGGYRHFRILDAKSVSTDSTVSGPQKIDLGHVSPHDSNGHYAPRLDGTKPNNGFIHDTNRNTLDFRSI